MNKPVFQLDKKASSDFYTTLGVVICKNHVSRPLESFNKYRKFILSSLVNNSEKSKFFLLKWLSCRWSFLDRKYLCRHMSQSTTVHSVIHKRGSVVKIRGGCPCIFLLSIFPTFLIFKINSETVYISPNLSL